MTHRELEFHPDAVAEARAAIEWYAKRSRNAAQLFLADLEDVLERVNEDPERFAFFKHGTRRALLRRFPYVVVFREKSPSIQIIAIAHAKRRPGYWRSRRSEV